MYRDYRSKNIDFYFIYKTLAHPGNGGYVEPVALEERLLHIKEAKRTLGATIPWIADTMSNDIKHALGGRPNSEFVIGPDGKIVAMRDWSNPDALRKDLVRLAGPVRNPTRARDLRLAADRSRPPVASGVVPRIDVPRGMTTVKVTAEPGKDPLYAKLRAQADADLMEFGFGYLYLAFNIDPIHHVHWNNLNDPVHIEFEQSKDVTVKPESVDGPKPEVEADIDPREFLVGVGMKSPREPIRMTVYYYACDDNDKWCKPVKQTCTIHLERDRDAGQVRGGGGRTGGGPGRRGRPPTGGTGASRNPADMIGRLMEFDRNDDGRVTSNELPREMAWMADRIDRNRDGAITKSEADQAMARFRRGR